MPGQNGCMREDDFERIEGRLNRIETDMWHGNGKPGVTVRLQSLEDRVTNWEKSVEKRETKQNIILGAVLSLVGMMVAKFIFHIG